MKLVTNQTELRNAVITLEPEIVIANDFELATNININYAVSMRSDSAAIYTLLKSASFFGNMFRIQNGGSLTLSNLILDGNKENHPAENITNRSLLLIAGGSLVLKENTIIQNNNTYLEGGGVYLSGNTSYVNHFTMEDNAVIRGCYARTNGGGIVAAIRNSEDTLLIQNQAVIEENQANYGGGLYYRIYTEGVRNVATIYDSPIFQNNTANNSGGAIAIFNISNNSESLRFNLPNTALITNNIAVNHGGGIYFVGYNELDLLDIAAARIENNQAGGYGGGIYTNSVLTYLNQTVIYQNTAGTGGGLYMLTNNGGHLEIAAATIRYNRATNGASGSGGGIWINNRSTSTPYTFQITESFVSNNSATAQGGGIFVSERANGLTVLVEKVDIKDNIAETNGAGMLLASAGLGSISVLDCSIENNIANNYGGGTYISNENSGTTTVLFINCEILNNQALSQGGGLRLASGMGKLETTLENSLIEGNQARVSSGGGIWNGGTDASLFLTKTTVVNQNETIEGNGGGIYFNSQNGLLRISDAVKISNNMAYQNASMVRNIGGGIYLIPGNFFITENSEIFGNKAKYGGGIGLGEQATATIESGLIYKNEAILGGGIYNQSSTIYFEGGAVYENQASIGGGIYNSAE